MEQILISGQYNNPVGQPLAGVRIILVARGTSNSTFAGAQVVATTDKWGQYSFNTVPGRYVASALHPDNREDYLGVMEVLPGSEPGTLNDFITALVPMDARPAILLAMQEILNEAREVTSGAVARPTGAYNAESIYSVNDLVQFEGNEYRATSRVTGVAPPQAPWELFLSRGEKGEPGEKGDTGEAGPACTLSVGEVKNLPAGSQATAEVTGEAPEQALNLGIPVGEKGDKGDTGEAGPANVLTIGSVDTLPAGSDARAEITGQSPGQVLNLAIPEGPAGPANSLIVGQVETLPEDSRATLEITGEAPEQVLNMGIPQGKTGAQGPQGEKGETGAPGPANVLAIGTVTTLPAGSEAKAELTGEAPAQVLSLGIPEGKTGEKGDTGAAGPANVLTVGTVEELPAGSVPTVEVTGDSPQQVLNFGFPKAGAGEVTVIASGETFDPLSAEPGTYWLETGATLANAPGSTLIAIYTCAVEVRVKTNSIRLTVTGHFNESAQYNHAGEWELMQVGAGWHWAATGPNTGIPYASAKFVIQGPSAFSLNNLQQSVSTRQLVTLVGAKLYGLLTDEQDKELKQIIESEMKLLEF